MMESDMKAGTAKKWLDRYNKIGEVADKFWSPKFLRPSKSDSGLKKTVKALGMLTYKASAVVAGVALAPVPTAVAIGSFFLYQYAKEAPRVGIAGMTLRDAAKNLNTNSSENQSSRGMEGFFNLNKYDHLRGLKHEDPKPVTKTDAPDLTFLYGKSKEHNK